MRRALGLAVSSALLFLSIPAAPHPPTLDSISAQLSGSVLISEFYPCALCSDEYFAILNAGSTPVNLNNWSVSDGEGTVRFTLNLSVSPGDRVCVSANASSFNRAFGREPEVSFSNQSIVCCTGTFRLADAGDSIVLRRSDGSLSDCAVYGDAGGPLDGWIGPPIPRLRPGEVAKRVAIPSVRDTDSSSDWLDFREYRYGFTESPGFSAHIASGKVVAFVSPDCSLDVILSGISSAQTSLRLCTYEFGSIPVCRALMEASSRGVSVRLLVDGSPAGGLEPDSVSCLSSLVRHGVSVVILNGNLTKKAVQHVGALHSKYMVVDSARSFVLSENFVESGLPSNHLFGNRGWGVEVEDVRLANYLSSLFDSDSRLDRMDVMDWRTDPRCDLSLLLPDEPRAIEREPAMSPLVATSDAQIHAFISPDASVAFPYLDPLITASLEVLISQFQADVTWDFRWTGEKLNPLIDSAVFAMRRGAEVRGLFDSSWYNFEGNKRIVELLSSLARNESLDGEFAQLDARSPISILHNKGVILDGKRTLVSSNNWCFASFARNRELALLIDSEEVAAYFEEAFEMDWTPDTTPPVADLGADRTAAPGRVVILDSRGCSDDRAIADWAWDLGADGQVDCADSVYELTLSRPGRYEVVLEVTDAWGNKAFDAVYIEVSDGSGSWSHGLLARPPWWIPFLSGLLGGISGVLLARRRVRPHKVNHEDGT